MESFSLDNHITIATAEGVRIELTLAGLATRMVAAIIDLTIYSAFVIGMSIAALPVAITLDDGAGDFFGAVLGMIIVFGFVMYPTLFETFDSGKTPGKRVMGIKVVTVDGHPPTFSTILTRNLLRLADFLPGAYLAGSVSILATEHSQRFGDLVANTIVVRESKPTYSNQMPLGTPDTAMWDVSHVTTADVLAIRHFLDRAPNLSLTVRNRVANELATTILPRVAVTSFSSSAEAFLRKIAYDKTNRS